VLCERGFISPEDLSLVTVTDEPADAVAAIVAACHEKKS
jgi:predicted Rossmann-fold nucleotide-binding protein